MSVFDVAPDSEDEDAEVVQVSSEEEDEDALQVRSDVPPLRFRGYRRGQELGSGASGKVFLCHRKDCTGGFAVKAVDLRRLQLSPNSEREYTSLCREVEILKSLPPHQAIVQLIDAFEEGHFFLLVLELVGGGDLFTVLTSREPPQLKEREAAFVLKQLANGLTFLHSQNVIHRDLKLENILVASERREQSLVLYSVKITDFGLSKAVGVGFSAAHSVVGTRPYTAPEVEEGGNYDFSADLWCLGVVLYVLLVGHFPFDKTPKTQAELDRITSQIKGGKVVRSIVSGLLRLDAGTRLTLDALSSHDWLQDSLDGEGPDRPGKRQRRSGQPQPPRAAAGTEANAAGSERSGSGAEQQRAGNGTPGERANGTTSATADRAGGAAADRTNGTPPPARPSALRTSTKESVAPAAAEAMPAPPPPTPPPTPPPSPSLAQAAAPAAAAPPPGGTAEGVEQAGERALEEEQLPASQEVGSQVQTWNIYSSGVREWLAHIYSLERGRTGTGEPPPVASVVPMGLATTASSSGPVEVVYYASSAPDVMQVHMSVPGHLTGAVIGKGGVQMKQLAAIVGCKVRMASCENMRDHLIIMIGNYNQCAIIQELVHSRLSDALRAEGKEPQNQVEVVLLVRAEAAGVVVGKQGFVLSQIRKQSGTRIQLLHEHVKGQRPCVLTGALQNILRAERHIFHIVRIVPTAAPIAVAATFEMPWSPAPASPPLPWGSPFPATPWPSPLPSPPPSP